jgi:hypothetical protein
MQMARGFLQHFCTRVLQPALLIGACPLSQLRRPMGRKRRRRHRIAMFASTCDIWSSMSEQFSVAILCHPFADAIIWTVCIKASGIDRILTVRPDMHVFGTSNIFVTSVACGSVSYCVENATLASHSQPCVTTYESRLPLSLVVAIKTDGLGSRADVRFSAAIVAVVLWYVGVQAATRCVVHYTKPYRIGRDDSGCSTRLGHAVCWQLFRLLQMAAVDIAEVRCGHN